MKFRFFIIVASFIVLLAGCESHEEEMARQEREAQEKAELLASVAKGTGNALSGVGSEATEALSKGVTDMVSGVSRGVEKGTEFPVSVNESLSAKGVAANLATRNLSNTSTSSGEGGMESSVSVYVTFDNASETVFQLRAFDKDGREIGRSNKLPMRVDADEGTYLHFAFDGQTPLSRVANMVLYETNAQAVQSSGLAPSEVANPVSLNATAQ